MRQGELRPLDKIVIIIIGSVTVIIIITVIVTVIMVIVLRMRESQPLDKTDIIRFRDKEAKHEKSAKLPSQLSFWSRP